MAEQKDISAELELIKSMVCERFIPASCEADADLMITTSDLCDRLEEYNGEVISKKVVISVMEHLGFKSFPNAHLYFVWMLKEK